MCRSPNFENENPTDSFPNQIRKQHPDQDGEGSRAVKRAVVRSSVCIKCKGAGGDDDNDDDHCVFHRLAGSALTGLVGFSMKIDDLPLQPMAQQLAQMTYGGGHPRAHITLPIAAEVK